MKGQIHKHPKHNTAGFDKHPENINRTGANRGNITMYLNELLSGNILEMDIILTQSNGKKSEIKVDLKSKVELNRAVATLLIQKALKGDIAAMREVLDRTEGKARQYIDHNIEGIQFHLTKDENEL